MLSMTNQMQSAQFKREYGLDILRSLSMFFIVCLHLLDYGDPFSRNSVADSFLSELLTVVIFPCVDIFVLLSGYFLSTRQFHLNRILQIWGTAVFWSVVIQGVSFILNPQTLSPGVAIYAFLPLGSGRYWFFNAYFVMFLMIPALNHLINTLSRQKLLTILLAVFALTSVFSLPAQTNDVFKLQNGYSFPWFLVLYLTGGYLHRYGNNFSRKKYGILYVSLVFVQILYVLLCIFLSDRFPVIRQYQKYFIAYTAPFVYLESICLLQLFRGIRTRSHGAMAKFFSFVSPFTLSVYLIHDHPLVQEHLIKGSLTCLANFYLRSLFF